MGRCIDPASTRAAEADLITTLASLTGANAAGATDAGATDAG